jgi:hypothetical protein
MIRSTSLRAICLLIATGLTHTVIAQEVRFAGEPAKRDEFVGLSGGNADQWIKALCDATVDEKCSHVLDRLSYFYLTPTQVQQLRTAADQENSDAKRVMLLHAIRLSQDTNGRDYLIHKLVEKSSPEMQIQFIESFRNANRFDIPILLALYNSHHPRKKIDAHAPRLPPKTEMKESEGKTAEGIKEKPQATDDKEVFGELFHTPTRIMELVCQSEWKSLLIDSSGSPFRADENVPEESRLKRQELNRQKSREAELAQEEIVYWLIRNGFEEAHRISAFEKYVHTHSFTGRTRTINADYAREFLDRLETSAGKAKAVWLVSGTVEPSRFLTDEAEVVRLSAIEAMRRLLTESRRAATSQLFLDRVALYKPIVEKVLDTDKSPNVTAAAKRLRGTMFAYEMEDTKANGVGR